MTANSGFLGHAKFPCMQRQCLSAKNILVQKTLLSHKSRPSKHRLTPIMCPIPRYCKDVALIENMIAAGVSAFRIVCAFGNAWKNADSIRMVRQACKNYSHKIAMPVNITIIVELKGAEFRMGHLEGGDDAAVELIKGGSIRLTINNTYADKGTAECVFVDYDELVKIGQPGMRIYMDFGAIEVICEAVLGAYLMCKVERGGTLRSQMRLHLQGVDMPNYSEITDKDKNDMIMCMTLDVDMILVSNVRSAEMVQMHRNYLTQVGIEHIKVGAKISTIDGISNIDEIAACTDLVIIGRNNLGVQWPAETVFKLQKKAIARCRKLGTPIVVSSQFLKSIMTMSVPRVTEMLDIANAIFDGATGLSLYMETVLAQNPILTIEFMDKACREAEGALFWNKMSQDLNNTLPVNMSSTETTALTTVNLAQRVLASAIIVCTMTGLSAALLSKYMPQCPVIAVTRYPQVARYMSILRSVYPLQYSENIGKNWMQETENKIKYAIRYGKARQIIKTGDPIVILKQWRANFGYINTIRLEYATHFLDEVSI